MALSLIELWPFEEVLQLPLYAVALVPLFIGFLLGWIWGWANGLPDRMYARQLDKELAALNGKIGDLQKSAVDQASKAKPKSFWSRL